MVDDSSSQGEPEVSGPLILVCMAIYACVGVDQFLKGNVGGAVMWLSYSTANIGLWMQAK